MSLVLYNSLTKREETFVPLEAKIVRMYTCGPTVYGRPHIGNYASFLMADLLRRWLETSEYRVIHVKNITDVGHLLHDADRGDDKVEREAQREKIHPLAIARRYTEQYLEDERRLRILDPHHRPRASETIPPMLQIIRALLASGHAYELPDAIYFAVESFPAYGKLSGNTLAALAAGARVEVHAGKRHSADFALWKKCVGENATHVLRWSFATGSPVATEGDDPSAGFPGWHIECSAMSRAFLGDTLDIHTGGEDNIFPHHECEIAQSESFTGKPFCRFFVHKRRIVIGAAGTGEGEQKMSKSLGNVLSLPDVVAKGFSPQDLRYYLLSVHYRTPLKFTWRGLQDARKARRRIMEWMEEMRRRGEKEEAKNSVLQYREAFAQAMDSDLNTPAALAAVFDCMTRSRTQQTLDAASAADMQAFVTLIERTFGCFEGEEEEEVPADVRALLEERARVRATGDFVASDRLRAKIRMLGFDVRDTVAGQDVRRA